MITTEAENERAPALVESLMGKGEQSLTPEEDALVDLLTNLIRDSEAHVYPSPRKSKSNAIVQFLLEERGLTLKDLWPQIGSRGRVSEIVTGKRPISLNQARKPAEFFHVGVELFI